MAQEQDYTSGLGKKSTLPPELKGWNWGAFFLNWIWGIGNSTYIALLMFVPIVNIVMIFVLGIKGNEWAWQNRIWRDVEHFKQTQRKWTISGLVLIFVFILLSFVPVNILLKGEAYKLSLSEIQSNKEVIELIGSPIEPSFFITGSMQTDNHIGVAELGYSISGPKGTAEVVLHAKQNMGNWVLKEMLVYSEEQSETIKIITPTR